MNMKTRKRRRISVSHSIALDGILHIFCSVLHWTGLSGHEQRGWEKERKSSLVV